MTDEETEAQRGPWTCLRPHSRAVPKSGQKQASRLGAAPPKGDLSAPEPATPFCPHVGSDAIGVGLIQPPSAGVMPTGLLELRWTRPIKPQQRSREEAQPWLSSGECPPPPTARWSVSNRPVTHDSLSSPERAVTMRGSHRKTWGDHCSQPPHLREGGQDRKGPAQDGRPAWSWHKASARPPYRLTWHRRPSSWPAPPHLPSLGPSLTPTGPGSLCSHNRGAEEGTAGQSCRVPAQLAGLSIRRAQSPSRPAHTSDPISGRGPGMHLGFAVHGPQPRTGSWESSPDERERINCPPVSGIPAMGCLLESSLEQKKPPPRAPPAPGILRSCRAGLLTHSWGAEVGQPWTLAVLKALVHRLPPPPLGISSVDIEGRLVVHTFIHITQALSFPWHLTHLACAHPNRAGKPQRRLGPPSLAPGNG